MRAGLDYDVVYTSAVSACSAACAVRGQVILCLATIAATATAVIRQRWHNPGIHLPLRLDLVRIALPGGIVCLWLRDGCRLWLGFSTQLWAWCRPIF
jgi:hypothetical protein